MEQNLTNSPGLPRRGAPLWVQILVWVGLIGLACSSWAGIVPGAASHHFYWFESA